MQTEIGVLLRTVNAIIKEDPDHPFHLGSTEVNVTAAMSLLSPFADNIDQTELQTRDASTVTQTISYLPGISVDHKSSRNQAGISVRGFDTGQVPVYVDGIPIYVPYDGHVGLNRFLTSDIAEIQIPKGYASPLIGAKFFDDITPTSNCGGERHRH